MRTQSLTALFVLLGATNVHAINNRHAHKRQTPPPAASGTAIPPIESITFGMPTKSAPTVTATFSPGEAVPVSGAPPLPTPFIFSPADWPEQDHIPPTDSDEVTQWMKELDGFDIPNLNPTVDGSCVNDTAAAADAANRGWWTCGGHTRGTDIVACPDKLTWGVSFDDGPSPYSHEISVHTWSHKHLTALTNEQIVAELGWTRHAIRTVLGVTPTTMRPPYGDIDDRVRAISLAMGMIPIMWTRTPDGGQFDTNDWKVAGGLVTGKDSFATFQNILSNASVIDTGFIVLQHDLYEITVDLAIGYTLNAALTHSPPFILKPIGQCSNTLTGNLYFESNQNATFPYTNQTEGGYDFDGDGVVDFKTGKGGSNAGFTHSIPTLGVTLLVAIAVIMV
ncbi:Chitin deacetylase [Hypsizygus marmoreus]|uniref:chitin deacetylase n=1 Tax=Hypsizygus marmoreus TaxID=39966 RepID=A0A369JT12_HYPMA|nr:Chitin deacetylase [Hypsizygus marmoreus]